MRQLSTILLTFFLFLPAIAFAHGPTRQKVSLAVDVKAAPAEVWAVVGNFQDMSWHPAVDKQEGKGGNAVDATRLLTLKGGGTIDEVLYKFEPEQKSYSYRIAEVDVKVLPVTNYSSTITVTPIDATHSKVEWRGAFYRGFPNNDPPPELSDQAAIDAVTGVYKAGLDALKAEMEK